MAIKILVTGDLHLGKRSSALPTDDPRVSVRNTWENIVQYVLNQQIDMLLLTGDIVDQDNKFYEATGPLQTGFQKLNEAGITVCMVAGNHDYDVLPQIISLNERKHIHLLGTKGNWESKIITIKGEHIRIVGWSFPGQYIDNDCTDYISMKGETDILTLGLTHGDIYSATSKYNPLQIGKMKNIRGVDAWLLGHIHRPEVLCDSSPLILYPGSPHALSPKEQGIHGPYLLTIQDKRIVYRQIPLSPVCYKTIRIDVSAVVDESSFRKTVMDSFYQYLSEMEGNYMPDFLVIDIEFTGTYSNMAELREWSNEIKNSTLNLKCDVRIRTIEITVKPPLDIDHLISDPSYIGVLATAIKILEADSTNDFTDKLVSDWKNRFRQTISLPVFSPLYVDISDKELDKMARDYILAECREIISELNNQRNEN